MPCDGLRASVLAGLVLFLLLGCTDSTAPGLGTSAGTGGATVPQAAIPFAFLPPIGAATTPGVTNDPSALPEVTVCELVAGQCRVPLLLDNTTTTGADGSSRVLLIPSQSAFATLWSFDQVATPGKIFRIRVLLATGEAGHVDLKVLSRNGEVWTFENLATNTSFGCQFPFLAVMFRVGTPGGEANVVHVVYLVPSDRSVQKEYEKSLQRAIENLQIWYRDSLGTGESFSLAKPIVQVYSTAHTASWYATQPNDCGYTLYFWCNALGEGFALTQGMFNDPHNIWVFYIDTDPGCGQTTGGTSGVALLPANDLRGISGQTTIDVCTGAPQSDQGVDRWVGGLGHELGHAFGLPHPPECDPVPTPSCPLQSIMWLGYITYPDAFLTDDEKKFLEESPFFAPLQLPTKLPIVGE